jgi:glycosyltransferase involved in cell wall biosynthesis
MKVRVLMSVYNGERYLKEQIQSVLDQKGLEIDLLIRDDGSSDSSIAIIEDFMKEHANIQLIKGENIGVIASFYELSLKAGEEYDFYAYCDQDDVWLEDKLLRAVGFLDKPEMPQLYCSKARLVDENLNFLQMSHDVTASKQSAMIQNIVIGCTCVMNNALHKLVVEKVPDYQAIRMHDSWFYKLAIFFGEVVSDDESRILYRQHGNNAVGLSNTFFGRVMRSIDDGRNRLYLNELIEFQKVFGERLAQKDYQENQRYIEAKQHISKRIVYLFHPYVKKQTILKNLWFKVQFLFNWV